MYYNRILRVWAIDPWDYFLISAFIGSLIASCLKTYLSEKAAMEQEKTDMERLKKSIINKSGLGFSKRPILKSNKSKIQMIYKFALDNRGGQLEELTVDYEFSNQAMKIAQQIQLFVERLAHFLKKRELRSLFKFFFGKGRLILELLLFKCNINMSYVILNDGLTTQVIVFTSTVGGAAGFTLSWFLAGASLVAPPLLLSTFLLRSFTQQIVHQRDYFKFKKIVNQLFDDKDIKKSIQAVHMEVENPVSSFNTIEMRPPNSDKNPIFQHDFSGKSSEELDTFIKEKIKKKFGLMESPTQQQLEKIIQKKMRKNRKVKTVYFQDFIKEIVDSESDLDIIDVEIMDEPIQIRTATDL